MGDITLQTKALAPNGKLYKAHTSASVQGRSGYIYAHGHRVYGRFGSVEWNSDLQVQVFPFTPFGKYAYLVQPDTSTVQPSASEHELAGATA